MTDKQLLQDAARAAGIDIWRFHDCGKPVIKVDGVPVYWSPLTDDGDANRLGAKLRINLEHGQHCVRAWTGDDAPVMVDETVFVPDESQRLFAVRESITYAAAAIGRGE